MSLDAAYVHNPAVDIAEFLEAEEPCAMGGIIECEGLLATVSQCDTPGAILIYSIDIQWLHK
jgi:hypothetical protein